MLKKIIETKSLRATGIVAFFPANSVDDDIHVFDDDNARKGSPRAVFYGLRQQVRMRWLMQNKFKARVACKMFWSIIFYVASSGRISDSAWFNYVGCKLVVTNIHVITKLLLG